MPGKHAYRLHASHTYIRHKHTYIYTYKHACMYATEKVPWSSLLWSIDRYGIEKQHFYRSINRSMYSIYWLCHRSRSVLWCFTSRGAESRAQTSCAKIKRVYKSTAHAPKLNRNSSSIGRAYQIIARPCMIALDQYLIDLSLEWTHPLGPYFLPE